MAIVKGICTLEDGTEFEVEYDDTEFEIKEDTYSESIIKYLHYIGNGKNVKNPKGNISCFNMFENYEGESLNLALFDTSHVVSMYEMFEYCRSLKQLDLLSFDTSKVENMRSMFAECKKLQQLDLSSFDTSKVEDMGYMFYSCESLQQLDLSSFDTSNVEDMFSMFKKCRSLQQLDLSSFNTSNVGCMQEIFDYCDLLQYASAKDKQLIEILKEYNIATNSDIVTNSLDNILEEIDKLVHEKNKSKENILKEDIIPKLNTNFKLEDIPKISKTLDIDEDTIIVELIKCKNPVIETSIKDLSNNISKVIENGKSKYTVNEMLNKLYTKFNQILVDKAMLQYIGKMYIEL